MRLRGLRSCLIASCVVAFSACYPPLAAPDAATDGGASFPPDETRDAATPPDGAVGLDASTPSDAGPAAPDATVELDAGPPDPDANAPDASEPDASEPDSGGGSSCVLPDLVVELPDAIHAASYRTMDVTEDDCELYEGCVGGQGTRALLELSFRLLNVGGEAIALGRPFENSLFYPSFCQDSYVIDGLFEAELYAADGSLVAGGRMSTSCIAGDDGAYTCRAQGLGAGEGSEQPIGRCDFLDVTGVPAGAYTLKITANPDGVLSECDLDNNSADVLIDYAPCEGTVCGGTCCPSGVACLQNTCMLPDLRINQQSAEQSLFITHRTFEADSCEMAEMCVGGGGRRRLLEFEGRIENYGPGDLRPGAEANNPLFEFSECHQHYHFRDFTDYRLLNADGTVAAQGHKQSFCLASMEQVDSPTPGPIGVRPPPGDTGCNELLAGWADIYGVGTDCQWVDITDVAPGDYVLDLAVNPIGRVLETNVDNNSVQIPVHITEDVPCVAQPEICGDNVDQDCDDQPDEWDPDCQVCFPGDPFCEVTVPATGNDSCAQAYVMTSQATYQSEIEDHDLGDVSACGGAGGDVFFAFTLDSEQVVYLGALASDLDTVLALYRDDCAAQPLRCEDDACGMEGGQLVQSLPAGHYVVALKAKRAGASGVARLKFQHADLDGAIVIDRPGVYAGDTSSSDDSVQATCPYFIPPPITGDGGVPDVMACAVSATTQAGDLFTPACVQCACERDPLAVVQCSADCWALIDCVYARCLGDGSNISCIVNECQPYIGGANGARVTAPALQACPATCPLVADGGAPQGGGSGGGIAGISGGGMGGSVGGMGGGIAGGTGGIGVGGGRPDGGVIGTPIGVGGRDDVYVLSACQSGLIVSTCGTAAFSSVLDVRTGALNAPVQSCSEDSGYCSSDSDGAVINTWVSPGLTFVVVDGRDEQATGEYQMSVIY